MEEEIKIINLKMEHEVKPKIYSKYAIFGFSFFCTTIFGGVLLMQNLKKLGNEKAVKIVLLFSIVFTVGSMAIIYLLKKHMGLGTVFNFIGGAILAEYFFKKYIPSADAYEKMEIGKPLIIALLITGLLGAFLIYNMRNIPV